MYPSSFECGITFVMDSKDIYIFHEKNLVELISVDSFHQTPFMIAIVFFPIHYLII